MLAEFDEEQLRFNEVTSWESVFLPNAAILLLFLFTCLFYRTFFLFLIFFLKMMTMDLNIGSYFLVALPILHTQVTVIVYNLNFYC